VVRQAGLEATVPAFYYAVARWHAEGTVEQKLEALQAYWQASLYARLSVLLAARGS
jgi:hypothetical protein